jgi:hypothetical protein
MWVVVYIAPNRRIAAIIKQLLEIEGILVKINEVESAKEERNVEVMVTQLEIEEANEVINNALQRF